MEGATHIFRLSLQREVRQYCYYANSKLSLPKLSLTRDTIIPGDPSIVASSQEKQNGVGTPSFDEKHASQRIGEPGVFEKTFKNATLGNDKGK